MKQTNYPKLVLTTIVTTFLMFVVLLGIIKAQPSVSCSAIGGIMTVLTAYLWRTE